VRHFWALVDAFLLSFPCMCPANVSSFESVSSLLRNHVFWHEMELDGYVRMKSELPKPSSSYLTSFVGPLGEITKDTAEKIFDTYVSRGGNFIDTANKV